MKKSKVAILIFMLSLIVVTVYLVIQSNSAKLEQERIDILEEKISSGFTSTATVTLNDITAVMDINKSSTNKLTFNIIEPEVLADFLFDYDGETVDISYKGLSLSLGTDGIIAQSMVNVLIEAINSATSSEGLEFSVSSSGGLLVSGEDQNGEFDLLLDQETGNFLNLSYPDIELECTFDDFIFAQQNE